jgi:hypothetical protein
MRFRHSGPDLRISTKSRELIADVTIRNLHAQSYRNQSPQQAFDDMDAEKQRRYGELCHNAGFELLTLSAIANGHLGPEIIRLLTEAAKEVDCDPIPLIDEIATAVAMQTAALRWGAEKSARCAPPSRTFDTQVRICEAETSALSWLDLSVADVAKSVGGTCAPELDLCRFIEAIGHDIPSQIGPPTTAVVQEPAAYLGPPPTAPSHNAPAYMTRPTMLPAPTHRYARHLSPSPTPRRPADDDPRRSPSTALFQSPTPLRSRVESASRTRGAASPTARGAFIDALDNALLDKEDGRLPSYVVPPIVVAALILGTTNPDAPARIPKSFFLAGVLAKVDFAQLGTVRLLLAAGPIWCTAAASAFDPELHASIADAHRLFGGAYATLVKAFHMLEPADEADLTTFRNPRLGFILLSGCKSCGALSHPRVNSLDTSFYTNDCFSQTTKLRLDKETAAALPSKGCEGFGFLRDVLRRSSQYLKGVYAKSSTSSR